jgi:hypothetical protein
VPARRVPRRMGRSRGTERWRMSARQPVRLAVAKTFIASLLAILAVFLFEGIASPATAHNAPQLAKAKKSLLVLSDLPKGWTSSKSSGNNSPFPGAAQLASCIGVPTRIITYNAPSVYSPEFDSKNQLLSAQDSVQVYSSSRAAQADFNSLANAKTPACMTSDLNGPGKSQFDQQIGGGTGVGSITVTRTPESDYAPHTTNFTMYFPVTTKGTTVNIEIILVDFVKGREEQTVSLFAAQSIFPTSLARHLTTVADGRI